MCGIVGYIGPKEACPILINGLKRLEYRGYDSAGIALIHNNNIQVYKCKGRVQDLEHHMELEDTSATIGMGHTRWATHGEPNDANAHPHTSMNGRPQRNYRESRFIKGKITGQRLFIPK